MGIGDALLTGWIQDFIQSSSVNNSLTPLIPPLTSNCLLLFVLNVHGFLEGLLARKPELWYNWVLALLGGSQIPPDVLNLLTQSRP